MSQKRKKIARARDAIVAPEHIHIAQQTMLRVGPGAVMERVHSVEPELAHFIMSAAKEVASSVLMDCEMPRPIAMRLCERISALALMVYGAYNLAVYEHYKNLFKGTAVEALDAEPEPPFPPTPPAPPCNGEEGGACGVN